MSSELSANHERADESGNDWYLEEPFATELRAMLKRFYLSEKEFEFGSDMKYRWLAESLMLRIESLEPEISNDWKLTLLCNKPTFFYWALSAQAKRPDSCPRIVFADIYKAWFRCHDFRPDISYGGFFAIPFRVTSTGPQTIPELLQAHAHMYDRAASRMNSIRSGEVDSTICRVKRWRRYNLLPLCQAIIVLYDEYLPHPSRESDGTYSLDKDIERRTAVIILTGHVSGLSSPIDFDTIRSSSLPLARDDVEAVDPANLIRVPLKTAMQFIAKLQQREEAARRSSEMDDIEKPEEPRGRILWEDVDNAEDYVEFILDKRNESSTKQRDLKYVLSGMEAEKRGKVFLGNDEEFPVCPGFHWPGSWV